MAVILYYLQWMLTHIQIKIIHLCKGYTKYEYDNIFNKASLSTFNKGYLKGLKEGFKIGRRHLANQLDNIAAANYGRSHQQWIDEIYGKIQEVITEDNE